MKRLTNAAAIMITMKRLLSILLIILIIITSVQGAVFADESTENGSWANDVSWSFSADSGTLTISGTGEMVQINNSGNPAWTTVGSVSPADIRQAVVHEGIINIYMYSFSWCSNLAWVSIPASVTRIEGWAFNGCGSLTDVYYGGTADQWGQLFIDEGNDPLLQAEIHFNETAPGTVPDSQENETGTSDTDSIRDQLVEIKIIPDKEKKLWEENFNETLYRAEFIAAQDSRWQSIQSNLQFFEPCQLLINNNRLDIGTLTWKVITGTVDTAFDLAEGVELIFEEQDVFSALILEMLECSSEYEVAGEYTAYFKEAKKVVSFMEDYASSLYQIGAEEDIFWEDLTDHQKEVVSQAAIDKYGADYPWLSGLSDVLDGLGTIAEYKEYGESIGNYIVSGMYLQSLSETNKELIRQMYDQCPADQRAMKAALEDCSRIIDSANDWGDEIVKGVAGKVTRYGLEVVLDQYKEIVVEKTLLMYPEIAVLKMVYDGAKLLCNFAFATDKLVEQYNIMKAVINLESLVDTVSRSAYADFCKSHTEEKADILLAAIDLQYAVRRVNLDKAAEFADTFNNAAVTQAFGNYNGAILKSLCENRRDNELPFFLYGIHTQWIHQMDADQPASALYVEYDTVYRKSVYESICKKEYWESYSKEDLEKRLEELQEFYANMDEPFPIG